MIWIQQSEVRYWNQEADLKSNPQLAVVRWEGDKPIRAAADCKAYFDGKRVTHWVDPDDGIVVIFVEEEPGSQLHRRYFIDRKDFYAHYQPYWDFAGFGHFAYRDEDPPEGQMPATASIEELGDGGGWSATATVNGFVFGRLFPLLPSRERAWCEAQRWCLRTIAEGYVPPERDE